jgi:cobalt/nickel transport system permease protein
LSLGANALMMGLPALSAYWIFALRDSLPFRHREAVAGFLAGAVSILLSGVILALWLATAGREFWTIARLALAAHLPIMILEGLICAGAAAFLLKVKPEILWRPSHAGKEDLGL